MALFFAGLLLIFLASQIFWARRMRAWAHANIRSARARRWLGGIGLLIWGCSAAFNFGWFGRTQVPTHMTVAHALLAAPFLWWFASSIVSFLTTSPFWIARWVRRQTSAPPLESPARRRFLERSAAIVGGAPFVAGAYGLFYGRINLQITRQPIRLARLPKEFHGFRIAQLSDIHIGPFMSDYEIRKYVNIANSLRPDMIVLTGDFVTWDPGTQWAVVDVLRELKAPYGVYGSLGNHDAWARVEDSITELFRRAGIHILRQERLPIVAGPAFFNLIGVDFQSKKRTGPRNDHQVRHFLEGVNHLIRPETANILLSHNPDTFDRAAELGIDLSLAGHTHGGQASLEFISPEIAPSRLVTPYVAGWFERPGGQLYVNRGIGTVGVPIRVGAPPEITVFELQRVV